MNEYYYFSPGVKLFYPVVLAELYKENDSLPNDVIKVDANTFNKFSPENKPEGKVVGCYKNGRPCWVNEPPPSEEDSVIYADIYRSSELKRATEVIAPLQDADELGVATADEKSRLLAMKKYRIALNRIDASAAPDIEWPEAPDVA